MIEFILWAVGFALLMPAYLAFMSFVMWDNAFKVFGWGYILRVTLALEILLVIATIYKHISGGI